MSLITPIKAAAAVTSAVEAAETAQSVVNTLHQGYEKLQAVKKTTVKTYQRFRNRSKSRARAPTRKNYRARSTGNFPSYQSNRAYNLKVERAYEMAYRKGYLPKPRNYRKKYTKRGSSLTKAAVRSIARKEINKTVEIKHNHVYGATNGSSGDLVSPTAAPTIKCGELVLNNTLGSTIPRGFNHAAYDGSHLRYLGLKLNMFVENLSANTKLGVRVMLLKLKRPGQNTENKLFLDNDNTAAGETADGTLGGTDGTNHINDLFQLYKPINKNRFDVKYNKVFFCDRNLPNDTRVANRYFQHYFKVNEDMTFDDQSIDDPVYRLVVYYQYLTTSAVVDTIVPKLVIGECTEYFIP